LKKNTAYKAATRATSTYHQK